MIVNWLVTLLVTINEYTVLKLRCVQNILSGINNMSSNNENIILTVKFKTFFDIRKGSLIQLI